MTRGTTPTLIFNFCEDIGVFRASKIIVSFAQSGETLFDKEIDIEKDVKENVVTLTLTQEETLAMKAGGYVQYQIRLLINGQAYATPIYKSIVLDVLNESTITAGEAVTEIPHAGIDDIDITNAKPTKAKAICECNEICVTVGQVSQVRGLDGKDGKDGIDGKDGVDGFSPTVEVVTNTDYNYTLKIIDKNGSYNTPNLKGNVKELNDRINEKIPISEKSSPNGVATLDDTGRVPATQLPSYVDDVLEFDNRVSFPEHGEDGKIYIAKDTNLQYRWGGSNYVEISSSLALGETPQTAYAGDKGKKNADDIAQAKKDISSINAIYRFSESSVSSSFSGQTELYKENMIGDGNPRIGDHVLFPDNKSLVLYIGTISAINDDSYTIDNISYVNEAIKASGDWVMGITANFPEMYNYAGGTYLCLTRDVTTAPVKGEEWFEISKPISTASETESGIITSEMFKKLEAQPSLTNADTLTSDKFLIINPPSTNWKEGIRLNAAENGVANFFFAGKYGSGYRNEDCFIMGTGTAHDRLCFGYGGSVNHASSRVEIRKDGTLYENNARVYSAKNEPPYPVTSVNDKTGEVEITVDDIGLTEEQTASLNSGATEEKIASIDDKLPLSGGTMTGNELYVPNSFSIISPDNSKVYFSDLGHHFKFFYNQVEFYNASGRNRNFYVGINGAFYKDGEVYSAGNPPPIVTDEQINSLFEG